MAASSSFTAITTSISQFRANYSNPPLSVLDSFHGIIVSARCSSARLIVCSIRSDKLRLSAGVNLSGGPIVKRSLQKRLVIRFATIEEIEAEKSAIETLVKTKMEKTIETLRTSFNSIRTMRSNAAMLDKFKVEYYGSPVNLKSITQISTPDGSSLLLQPYDKSSLKAIEKAIVDSDRGVAPNNDGDYGLFLQIFFFQEKKLSEDSVKDLSSDLKKLFDTYTKKIEELGKQKEKELMKV